MNTAVPVVTIDGPGGAGKGTLARALARQQGWHYLDSGALYRALAWLAEQAGLTTENAGAIAALAERLDVRFDAGMDDAITVNGRDTAIALRDERVAQQASQIAALPAVRAALLQRQRDFRRAPGLVADGRDLGSVVFPDALLKVFLYASPQERAQRRYKQLSEQGLDANLAALLGALRERDARDRQRADAPLRAAPDALELDTTTLTIDAAVAQVMKWLEERLAQP